MSGEAASVRKDLQTDRGGYTRLILDLAREVRAPEIC